MEKAGAGAKMGGSGTPGSPKRIAGRGESTLRAEGIKHRGMRRGFSETQIHQAGGKTPRDHRAGAREAGRSGAGPPSPSPRGRGRGRGGGGGGGRAGKAAKGCPGSLGAESGDPKFIAEKRGEKKGKNTNI